MNRRLALISAILAAPLLFSGCGSSSSNPSPTTSQSATAATATTAASPTSAPVVTSSAAEQMPGMTHNAPAPAQHPTTAPQPVPAQGSWDNAGNPVNGGPSGADGSTGNNLTRTYCTHNQDPACPAGVYVGPAPTTQETPAPKPGDNLNPSDPDSLCYGAAADRPQSQYPQCPGYVPGPDGRPQQ